MASLSSLVRYLDSLLEPAKYDDYGLNGLQVEVNPDQTINRVAIAVDAGESVIRSAIEADADCLIVHHGLYWGGTNPITGIFGRKIGHLIKGHCSLYAAHLPLDGNIEVGNAAELARIFCLENIEPCFNHRGMPIGVKCNAAVDTSFESILAQSESLSGFTSPFSLLFGPEKPSVIGIATGSAAPLLAECPDLGIDTLISGEPKQEAYHVAKELGLNALFLGHYASETTGVKAVARRLEKDLDISTVFIDEPTGI